MSSKDGAPVEQQSQQLVDFTTMIKLMQDQNKILTDIQKSLKDDRIANETHTSVKVWRNLWDATNNQIINPKREQLRSNLGNLLVFIGLFTAIVAAFFVDSLKSLQQDEATTTNQYISNLTDIFLAVHNRNFSTLGLDYYEPFKPEPIDVRFNFYLSNSLITSVAISAVSVLLLGFVLFHTPGGGAYPRVRLTNFYFRWVRAEKFYQSPAMKIIPGLMVIPVVYFLVGFIDYFITLNLSLPRPSTVMVVFYCLTTLLLLAVFSFGVVFALFQWLPPIWNSLKSRWTYRRSPDADNFENFPVVEYDGANASITLTPDELSIYHGVIRRTYDDNLHAYAAKTVKKVLFQNVLEDSVSRFEDTIETVIFLLSPYATLDINKWAMHAIRAYYNEWTKDDVILPVKQAPKHLNKKQHMQNIRTSLRKDLVQSLCEYGDRLGEREGYSRLYESDVVKILWDLLKETVKVEEGEPQSAVLQQPAERPVTATNLNVRKSLGVPRSDDRSNQETEHGGVSEQNAQRGQHSICPAVLHLVGSDELMVSYFAFQIIQEEVHKEYPKGAKTSDKQAQENWDNHILNSKLTEILDEKDKTAAEMFFNALFKTLQYVQRKMENDKSNAELGRDFARFMMAIAKSCKSCSSKLLDIMAVSQQNIVAVDNLLSRALAQFHKVETLLRINISKNNLYLMEKGNRGYVTEVVDMIKDLRENKVVSRTTVNVESTEEPVDEKYNGRDDHRNGTGGSPV